jgi:hypothetical protein
MMLRKTHPTAAGMDHAANNKTSSFLLGTNLRNGEGYAKRQ